MSTQFGAVGYIITLYLSKCYVQMFGGPDPRPLSGCVHDTYSSDSGSDSSYYLCHT